MGDIINDLIVRCVAQTGATTVTITHDMQSAHKIADRIAMIFQGKIIWIGGTDEINDSGNEYVDQFIQGRTDGPIQMACAVNGAGEITLRVPGLRGHISKMGGTMRGLRRSNTLNEEQISDSAPKA